jgi:hypothetical protein
VASPIKQSRPHPLPLNKRSCYHISPMMSQFAVLTNTWLPAGSIVLGKTGPPTSFPASILRQQHLPTGFDSCPPHGAFLWGNGIVIVRLAEWPVPLWGLSEG